MHLDPIIVALVMMLGAPDFQTRQTGSRILAGVPQARLAIVCMMERDAETHIRGEQLLRLWDEEDSPHPKAGYRYLAKHRATPWSWPYEEVTVDVANIEDGWAAIRMCQPSYPYLEWMLVRDWRWELIPAKKSKPLLRKRHVR